MEIEQPSPGIMVIKKGFPQVEEFYQAIKKRTEWRPGGIDGTSTLQDWRKCDTIPLTSLASQDTELQVLDEQVADVWRSNIKEYQKVYPLCNVETDLGYTVLRYQVDQYCGEHADYVGKLSARPRVLTGIMYLNDDYRGGSLVFPKINLSIQPEAGMVVFFPSNYMYPHRVDPVVINERYALLTWFS